MRRCSTNLVPENYIDLKPDPSLLDANFDGYKLSLDPFPCYSTPLEIPVRELQTSNAQYGLEHIKLFGNINYLTYDLYSSDRTHKRFITVLQDFRICAITFDIQTKLFSVRKNYPVIAVPSNYEEREDRYPATVSFPDDHYAFVANGFGSLIMYNTGDRRTETPWEECLNIEPLRVDDEIESFVIAESRFVKSKYDVLLRSVVQRKGNFSNKAVWLTVANVNGKMAVDEVRNGVFTGHIEMVTFDKFPESLIIVGTGDLNFDGNEMGATNVKDEEMKEEFENETAKTTKKKYAWSQTATDVTAVFTCAETVSKNDVSLSLSGTSVYFSVKGTVLLGGILGGSIDPTSSTYTIDDNKLELFLSKSGSSLTNWTQLVLGDDNGTYEIDPESLSTASELLERFTSESQALGESGAGQNFNTEQLEECDASVDEIYRIRWLNCATHKITHESDITGHSVLFSALLDSGPRFLCIRMDVDGILWKFTDDNKKVLHCGTFSAFGYVQASKTQRRFSTCPADCSYAAIVEAKRHAFVYWQPIAVNSDLRNRKTGRRVAGIAKQQLISLSKRSEFGDAAAVTENIVGVHADSEFLFILTTADIFAVFLKDLSVISS